MQSKTVRRIAIRITIVAIPLGVLWASMAYLHLLKYDRYSKNRALLGVEFSAINYWRDTGHPPTSVEELINAGYITNCIHEYTGDEYASFWPGERSSARWEHVKPIVLDFPSEVENCVLKDHRLVDQTTGIAYDLVRLPGWETPPEIKDQLAKKWLEAARQDSSEEEEGMQ